MGLMAPTKGSAGGCEGDTGPENLCSLHQPSWHKLFLNSLFLYVCALPLGRSSAIFFLLSTRIPSCYTSTGSLCVP